MSSSECAVVLTAGYGSRLFPVTAVVPKSLMPVLDRPVLHYLLADLVAAGVDDIGIVADRSDQAIRHYVDGLPEVAATLERRGWGHKFEPIARAYEELAAARFTIIEQDLTAGDYGTAVPARLAAEFVGERSCFYLSGDDLLTTTDGRGNAADLADLRAAATDCLASMQVTTVPAELAHRYGIVELRDHGQSRRLVSLIEKSSTSRGSFANISRYYLTPAAFRVVSEQPVNPGTGEAMITDAMLRLLSAGPVGVSVARGHYFDCGSLDGWHRANVAMMQGRKTAAPSST
ncbi:sugar phosphate nucleotidyltransferase [Microlunatus parietis]|uniref:UTP--glucose-1-phosphate uridylyltransferase n=1 Tax=Microlunatus parietis TaxID=682979 RepID=A0A7Y9I5T0_9ACTN|nr:sugar phosphate nucleotidyltransferase [Microlunatus parietis]NYE70794.1 UTP--glucose-1-phosphate uridylyltransferase [Microlunatus parietis]